MLHTRPCHACHQLTWLHDVTFGTGVLGPEVLVHKLSNNIGLWRFMCLFAGLSLTQGLENARTLCYRSSRQQMLVQIMQGLKSLMNRLETALHDASQQRGLSRSSSRRTSREAAGRQLSRNSSTRRRSMASPTNSLRQSREGFEANLAAERSVLPAGLHVLAAYCFACHC